MEDPEEIINELRAMKRSGRGKEAVHELLKLQETRPEVGDRVMDLLLSKNSGGPTKVELHNEATQLQTDTKYSA